LAQEIAEGLNARGHWRPKESASSDLIGAIFLAIDTIQGDFEKAMELVKEADTTDVDVLERLVQWVQDLQSRMFVNCIYCGHRYGPSAEVPASMADVLKEHIKVCPEHPMSKLQAKHDRLLKHLENQGIPIPVDLDVPA
jgi:hypothetical protein